MYYLVNRKQYVNIGYPLQILWSKSMYTQFICTLYIHCNVHIDNYTPLFNKF